jgi:hypothetical protein
MTTRPGYVWDATASEWVEIGQAAVVAPVAYQASEPSSPATGDIWIDSDDEVPSVDSTLYYRWTKTMSGGETSLSGTDNNSLALKYTPGYESVFINGVLQVRGSDYVATTGTTVTGLIALTASDVVMVESIIAYSVGDTYTQAAADAKFYSKTSSASSGEASTVNINTKPWNMPWGLQAHVSSFNNTITSAVLVGLTTSFTFVNNRRYKVSAMVSGQFISGRALGVLTVGSIGGNRIYDVSSGSYFNFGGYCVVTGTGTSQTITVGMSNVSGSTIAAGDGSSLHTLTIEDIGPA